MLCKYCKEDKPKTAFRRSTSKLKSGLRSDAVGKQCIECINRGSRKLYEDRTGPTGRYRREHGWRCAGILNCDGNQFTHTDFDTLWEEQDGKCSCCEKQMDPVGTTKWKPLSPCVDHNHDTYIARGILCFNCNRGIGMFNDDVKIVERVLFYLSV